MRVSVAVMDTEVQADLLPPGAVLAGFDLRAGEGAGGEEGGARAGGAEAGGTVPAGPTPETHGTAVAREILRVAPGAQILPVVVMNGRGQLQDPALLTHAFRWIRENAAAFNVSVICAPFADFSHRQDDLELRGSPLQREIAALRDGGILTVAAAGNWYPEFRRRNPQGMAWPAILREVISAGALERRPDGLWLTRTTQRLHANLQTACSTTVFAEPGGLGETSGAAAVVAGYLAAQRLSGVAKAGVKPNAAARDEAGLEWPALDYQTRV